MNFLKVIFFIIFMSIQICFAGKEFSITPIGQEYSLWCWAACCEMVFDAYKLDPSVNQYEIANWAVNGGNVTNNLSGNPKSVDGVLWHFGSILTDYTMKPTGTGQGSISKEYLTYTKLTMVVQ